MKSSLAGWLADNRDTLLPRWIALLEESPYATNGNGLSAGGHSANAAGDTSDSVAHPGESQVLLTSIYEGLIIAASGDHGPLDDCLRLLRALRTRSDEDELSQQLVLAYK